MFTKETPAYELLGNALVLQATTSAVGMGFASGLVPTAFAPPVVGRLRKVVKDGSGSDDEEGEEETKSPDRRGAAAAAGGGAGGILAAMEAAKEQTWVGRDALGPMKPRLDLTWTVQSGIATEWEDMLLVLEHLYENELQVDSKDHPVMLVEPTMQVRKDREDAMQTLFEQLAVPAMYNPMAAVMALYAHNKTTGLVIDAGKTTTSITPVYEGHAHRVRHVSWPVSGQTFDRFLQAEVAKREEEALPLAHAPRCKQALCFLSTDFEEDTARAAAAPEFDEGFDLPDGTMLTVGKERFRVPELMFRPELAGPEFWGEKKRAPPALPVAVRTAVRNCPIHIRDDMWENVLMTGGALRFNQRVVKQRCTAEFQAVAGDATVNITQSPDLFDAWRGAAVLASMDQFRPLWVLKSEYEEHGVDLAHRRCL